MGSKKTKAELIETGSKIIVKRAQEYRKEGDFKGYKLPVVRLINSGDPIFRIVSIIVLYT